MLKRVVAFCRYNSRHTLWFPRDGRLPQLNPITSSSHNAKGQHTWRWTESLWMFRLRLRLFCFAGRHRCGSRDGQPAVSRAFGGDKPLPDTWNRGPDGNRTCSYCGSIHPDDLMAICRKTLDDERYGIEGTTKSYKVYVRQPGVQNAGQGAIKFYMHHAPGNPTAADQELFKQAVRLTSERFQARYSRKPAA